MGKYYSEEQAERDELELEFDLIEMDIIRESVEEDKINEWIEAWERYESECSQED